MTAPKRIWAWYFRPDKQDDPIQGGWTEYEDAREQKYIRADLVAELVQAAEELDHTGTGWRALRAALRAIKETDT